LKQLPYRGSRNSRRHRTKCSRSSELGPRIFVPLLQLLLSKIEAFVHISQITRRKHAQRHVLEILQNTGSANGSEVTLHEHAICIYVVDRVFWRADVNKVVSSRVLELLGTD
jgi:hypothetical protein